MSGSTNRRSPPPPPHDQNRRSARISAQVTDHGDKKPSAKRRKLIGVPSSTTTSLVCDNDNMPPLLSLGKLIQGTLVKRPSATIKSPYVADVSLFKGKKKSSTTVLAHAPALDVGGMCVAGSEVYLTERKGEGKTSHSIELVRGAPLANTADGESLKGLEHGELIAAEVLKRGLLTEALPLQNGFELGPVNDFDTTKGSPKKPRAKKRKSDANTDDDVNIQTKPVDASNITSKTKISLRQQVTLGDSRLDFQMTLTHPLDDTSHQILFEVKNVVCADYEEGTEPTKTGPGHCVVVAPPSATPSESENAFNAGYQRSALFPWGRTRGQKFEGKSVVSERACKHLRNLQSLHNKNMTTVVLFIVNRSDCNSVRACQEKCPVFAEVLDEVVKAGVKALAVRVRWTQEGECLFDGVVPVKV
ncbi:LOW QUALITY PROTEIN: hypothetical protein ACHAXR_008949 [Thalassiosira sp. AJA248-18]